MLNLPLLITNGKVNLAHPSVSPLFGSYKNLPPLFFVVGSSDVLLSDTLRAAYRARKDGVEVKMHVGSEMQHCFDNYPNIPEAMVARKEMKTFLDINFGKN